MQFFAWYLLFTVHILLAQTNENIIWSLVLFYQLKQFNLKKQNQQPTESMKKTQHPESERELES